MTSGLQLLTIFQFPGLSSPLANPVSCAHGGVGFREEDGHGCGHWLSSTLPDGWAGPFLRVPGQIAQIFENAVLLHPSSLGSYVT